MRLVSRLRRALHSGPEFLRVEMIRHLVGSARFLWLARVRRRLRTVEGGGAVSAHTVSYNVTGMRDRAVARSNALIRPLSVIETLGPDSRILSIGPRTEGELLNLVAHGFKRRNIQGLDLISYSPWIQLGDMHALPFADGTWDAVVMGWVISYSDDPRLAAAEAVRVTKPGGVIAVGVEYNPAADEEIEAVRGHSVGSRLRPRSLEDLIGLFAPHVGHVYYAHPIAADRRDRVGAISAIFSVDKH